MAITSDVGAQSPYASELISQNAAYGGASLYNDPNAVLGEPTRAAVNNDPVIGVTPFHVKMVEPAYNRDLSGNKVLTTLSRKSNGAGGYTYGSITVKFDQPVVDDPFNPYGIDLNVFGNAFYVGDGYVHDTTDMRTYNLVGGVFAEPVVISVSPDNENWYTYSSGPYGDTAFPTQGYAWNGDQHDLTGNGWTDEATDFTKPVNPTLSTVLGAPDQVLPTIDAIGSYVGSGGGTGIDLAPSGFEWIQYVRVESTAQFRDGEIDGFADVQPTRFGDALAVTPQNVEDGTPLYFQSVADAGQNLVTASFTDLADHAKLTTASLSDPDALAALDGRELLAGYELAVSALFNAPTPAFVADYTLSAGDRDLAAGAGVDVLAWDGAAWRPVAFVLDSENRVILTDWTEADASLAITRLAGDFNTDGRVDAADYVVWRNGLDSDFVPSDYGIWSDNYGASLNSLPPTLATPEPQGLLLAGLGVVAILARRRQG